MSKILSISLLSCLLFANAKSCSDMILEFKTDAQLHDHLKSDKASLDSVVSNLDCLDLFVRVNYFSTAKLMLEEEFGKVDSHDANTGKALSKAQSVVQSAIQYVKDQQDDILQIFESTQQMSSYSDSIPIISPSMRWAQSVNTTFIEVKFATRFDSPACLDIFDHATTLKNRTLSITAMCRNDKKLLKYQTVIELSGDIAPFELTEDALLEYDQKMNGYNDLLESFKSDYEAYTFEMSDYEPLKEAYDAQQEEIKDQEDPNEDEMLPKPIMPKKPKMPEVPQEPQPSLQEMQSVGRLLLSLVKTDAPSRWRKISNEVNFKKANVQVWWELHEKYEDSLVKLQNFDDEDDKLFEAAQSALSGDEPTKKKKSKKNKKKKSKSSQHEDL